MQARKRRLWLLVLPLAALAAVLLCIVWRQTQKPKPTIPIPAGSQVLAYPLAKGYITAGYLNARYVEKNHFQHYGLDIVPDGTELTDVLAAGDGTVLGTESCPNSVGNIAVIQYDNVYDPSRAVLLTVIARYYHMLSLSVHAGDSVSAGQPIGAIQPGHRWYNHSHIELDTDVEYPFNTPQVAEASSELLRRHPATGQSMLDPVALLAVRQNGFIRPHPNSDCCEPKDEPHYFQWDFYTEPES